MDMKISYDKCSVSQVDTSVPYYQRCNEIEEIICFSWRISGYFLDLDKSCSGIHNT